jgi:hypothetical protein
MPSPRERSLAPLRRPVFLLSPPRAGSTLLFETLAASPDVWTICNESHRVFESVPGLHPRDRGWSSNRLVAGDATADVVERLTQGFRRRLMDRTGRRPGPDDDPVLLEKTPKNALRVPFLAAAYPDARFVYLHREPVETMSSMLDGWRSGRFNPYPDLPGWTGRPWSFLLVPRWRELIGRELAEIVVTQWHRTVDTLLGDLAALPARQWCVADYTRLVADPAAEVGRLCGWLGIAYDRDLTGSLRPSRSTLTPPDADKWRRNAPDLYPLPPLASAVADRTRALAHVHSGD